MAGIFGWYMKAKITRGNEASIPIKLKFTFVTVSYKLSPKSGFTALLKRQTPTMEKTTKTPQIKLKAEVNLRAESDRAIDRGNTTANEKTMAQNTCPSEVGPIMSGSLRSIIWASDIGSNSFNYTQKCYKIVLFLPKQQ
jgi:hypothetical protein